MGWSGSNIRQPASSGEGQCASESSVADWCVTTSDVVHWHTSRYAVFGSADERCSCASLPFLNCYQRVAHKRLNVQIGILAVKQRISAIPTPNRHLSELCPSQHTRPLHQEPWLAVQPISASLILRFLRILHPLILLVTRCQMHPPAIVSLLHRPEPRSYCRQTRRRYPTQVHFVQTITSIFGERVFLAGCNQADSTVFNRWQSFELAERDCGWRKGVSVDDTAAARTSRKRTTSLSPRNVGLRHVTKPDAAGGDTWGSGQRDAPRLMYKEDLLVI